VTQALWSAEPCPPELVQAVGKGEQAHVPHEEIEAWRG